MNIPPDLSDENIGYWIDPTPVPSGIYIDDNPEGLNCHCLMCGSLFGKYCVEMNTKLKGMKDEV